ncbi:uncharacterized protein METZ01_LOCUS286504, partial [marine metagenome]
PYSHNGICLLRIDARWVSRSGSAM